MSVHTNHIRNGSSDSDRSQSIRNNPDEYENDSIIKKDKLPNIIPELSKIIRKLLPNEILLNFHVRNVEYFEYGCERLSGTLYMTIFRLVFAPDNEIETNQFILSGNKYIGEYDIPLTSIYRINVIPNDSRAVRRTLRNEQQGQIECQIFTILTRDFRSITFSKYSTKQSKSDLSLTKMETYIDALKFHTRFQDKEQLYPYIATQKSLTNVAFSINDDDYGMNSIRTESFNDNLGDFCASNDERIKSYLIYSDWYEELQEANDNRWMINEKKFRSKSIVQDEPPFIHLKSINNENISKDWIWHWTHTSEIEQNQIKTRYMLVTIPGLEEMTITNDSHRRSNGKNTLTYINHSEYNQTFQRYNLNKFPCNLKKLEISYEKLLELCVNIDDDEQWLTKLDGCQWLGYVSKALHGAVSLSKLLNYTNIQLIGSDVDNSCLMSSLIQIFLRPKCRTIKGFCELIVREWIIRGHPFRERFGQVIFNKDRIPVQESPIFLLFLDCVHQLLNQNPFSFEFTEYFLIEIYHSVCYCYHHTFAFNTIFERLTAIEHCPKNLLILSVFDFSLYLQRDIQYLLKNHAAIIFEKQISVPRRPAPPPPPSSYSSRTSSIHMTHIHELLTQTLTVSRPTKSSISLTTPPVFRRKYRLELPKSNISSIDFSSLNSKQFEYDDIEAPQKFSSNLCVDWRLISLVLWSKCYCRYEHNSIPTLAEQELIMDICSLQQNIENTQNKDQQLMQIDAFHSINYANSWYPQLFVTRV